ncbi:hypothetical protein O3M35_001157 [Rhynocoris fuscipes]|uniref:Carbohydrate kinase PfkB domain-containing protein n=1 Tax=Rhynocoris fuscipes TaxID=488301 RepID=A0AAW1DQA2_9HEMI
MDGRTLPGIITQTPGGVGRNIADALGKLYRTPPLFLSAVGSDQFGTFLLESVKHVDSSGVAVRHDNRTACYSALIDKFGDAKLGVGDMQIHSSISEEQVEKHKSVLVNSPMIIMDGNIPQTIWFEPTDVLKSTKPFQSNFWKSMTCISPNINELVAMANAIGVTLKDDIDYSDTNILLKQLSYLAAPLAEHIPLIMVTMGKRGLMMVSRSKADEVVIDNVRKSKSEIFMRHYPSKRLTNIVNSVGAGDSTAAGFISGMLQGFTETQCVNLGLRAAVEVLYTNMAVPKKFETSFTLKTTTDFINIPVS